MIGDTWSLKPRERKEFGVPSDEECHESAAGMLWRSFSLHATVPSLCWVFHDGKGKWDTGPDKERGHYRISKPGRYALKDGRISLIRETLPPVLVVTDLDGTYVGDDEGMRALNDAWERQCVHSKPKPSAFVYNTGLSLFLLFCPVPRLVASSARVRPWQTIASGEAGATKRPS